MTQDREIGAATALDDGDRRRRRRGLGVSTAVSMALLALWAAVWVKSVGDDGLVLGRSTWVPVLPFLAGDFKIHIDHVARIYATGVNPYLVKDDWVCALFPYPPMVPRLFSWVSLVSTTTAVRVWLAVLAGLFGAGAYAAWSTRRALGLRPLPLAAVAAAMVYSTPAVYAMERGQCDPLVIAALLAVAWLLRRRSPWHDLSAGGVLAVAAWLKYYPGLAAVAFLALGRRRALAAFVVVAGLIGVVDRVDVARSIGHGLTISRSVPRYYPTLALNHSIVAEWRSLWVRRHVPLWHKVPPPAAAAVLLLPAVAALGRRVSRARDRGALVFPFLLWLTAAATFAMPYSVDYNLVCLPLAALAVWDRRDPVAVHLVMGLFLVYWQPFRLPISGELIFYVKLAALYAVGVSLAVRAVENRSAGASGDEAGLRIPRLQSLFRPANRRRTAGAANDHVARS